MSNCGDVLRALLPSDAGNGFVARLITCGMVRMQSMSRGVKWTIRSQVLRLPWSYRMQFTD